MNKRFVQIILLCFVLPVALVENVALIIFVNLITIPLAGCLADFGTY